VPVTAKLSKRFYDRFGDEITNELVDWFNQVDATYKAELRELNELNWKRYEAKLDQRTGELRAELSAKIETSAADLKTYVERALKEQSRWFIAAWAVLLGSNIALWFR
jgi:hypothetical protein